MADLVVGLAKSVVEGALTKAQSAIEEEAKLRQSAQRDLVFITGEFEMMHSFLNVASRERVENKVVMTWVRQVRELAYDVEDCIEFVIHLDAGTTWWRRLVPSCMTSVAQPLDEAVDEIEQLKARVENVSTRNSRYSLIGDSGSKPAVVQQQQQPGDAVGATVSNMLAEARDAARRRTQGPGDLTQLITKKDKDLQVVTVWGTAGDLGTTSIIRKAYHDPEISQNFTCRAWVKLMHPFVPREFVCRFMAQVYANSSEEQGARVGVQVLTKMEATHGDDLLGEFVEEVNKKRYLVVLEGLSDMVDWDAIRTFLPDMKNGSWIIVSTQQFEIASLCIGHPCQPLELKQFSADHSVCAFFKKGCEGDGDKSEELMVCEVSLGSFSHEKSPSFKKKAAGDWMNKYPLKGRESQMNNLRKHTAEARFNTNSQVISVWGIAGVGKSALVKNLYYDRMLHSDQFNKYSWVDVSHPFNLRDFSRSLLLDFDSEKDPIKECRQLLEQHQCLVVIDDLQCKEEWDLIHNALVARPSRSVIIVITTEASVAAYCTNNEEMVFNVKGLEAAAAVDLFKKEVHRKKPSSPLIEDRKDAELEELILKCGGLPKVIVAIAGLLATQTVTLMDTVRSLNRRFMHHLETNPEYDSLQGLFGWMYSYFRTCPDSLKPCIFYLSIFPRDQTIRRRRLVRRWIAEGYSRDNDEKSAEETGEKFFSKLLELSIIQQLPQLVTTAFGDTRMVLCQVNGFIREYIVSRRMEENLVFELGGNCALTTQRTGRHLIILKNWDRDMIVFESIDFSRLRSLTVFGKWESFFISKSMRLLRVLDLEDALGVNDDDVEKMVKLLRRLKFLSLRGCSEIRHLPSSLGDLRQLQSLDVRHTSIVTLPANITKLQKLQYIRAGTTLAVDPASTTPVSSSSWLPMFRGRRQQRFGVVVPGGIGKLTVLHTLGVINVGASRGKAMVEELRKLTQLRKLGVSGINMHNSKELFSAISGHFHLESLLVRLDNDNQGCLDDISLPLENLRSLKLFGLQDKLPLLSNELSKLRKLDLEMDTFGPSDIELLARLPKLCILRLHVKQLSLCFYAELCGYELLTYEKVKILEIACSSTLHLTFGSKAMKNLELLKLDCSGLPGYKLSGLNHLSELKEVLLKGTVDETIKEDLQSQLANHPKKPVVMLELPRSS